MRSRLFITIVCCAVVTLFAIAENSHAEEFQQHRILLLQDSSNFSRYAVDFNSTLFEQMIDAGSECCLHVEMLGLGINKPGIEQRSIEYLKSKYPPGSVDVVVSLFPGTAEFLLRHDLFPGIPMIAVATRERVGIQLLQRKDTFVVSSSASVLVEYTIRSIHQIYPDTSKLYVIGGSSDLANLFMSKVAPAIAKLPIPLETEFITGLPLDELNERIVKIPSDATILYLSYLIDREGKTYRSPDVLANLSRRTGAPIFGIVETFVGAGLLGAYSITAAEYAKITYQILRHILENETRPDPIDRSRLVKPYFDWNQMQRFGLSEADLPENAILKFKPISLWDNYRQEIIIASIFVAILLIASVVLSISLIRQHKVEQQLRINGELLRQSEADYRLMADNSTDLIFKVVGNETTYISPAVLALRGYTQEEVMQQKIEDTVTKESWERLVKEFLRSPYPADPRESKTSVLVVEMYHKDGSTIPMEIAITSIFDEDRNAFGYIGVARDISDRLAAEEDHQEQLRQSQKMQALGTLTGGIAHDFNNVLTPILGYAEMLVDGSAADHNDTLEYAQLIYENALRAKDLISQILLFSRHNRAVKEIEDVCVMIPELIRFAGSTMPSTTRVHTKMLVDSATVFCDAAQIYQVLVNLCVNAGQAITGSGNINLALNIVELEDFTGVIGNSLSGRHLQIAVTDDGVGMDKETLGHIFEPFYTNKGVGEGTGLGLSTVFGIIQDHDGEIAVTSKVGEGTSVEIYLPLSLDSVPEKSADLERSSNTGTEHILLVDDEDSIRSLGKRSLEGSGYQVTDVSDGWQALNVFKENIDRFDLLITDQTMPNMTGDVLAREVLKLRPDLPIILCSGHNMAVFPENIEASGISGFLYKPYGPKDLRTLVRDILDGDEKTRQRYNADQDV